jgi:capsular polysaccharide biosynthesis protein
MNPAPLKKGPVHKNERQVHNEKEVLDELKPLGFERVFLPDMTVSEQIELFLTADVVVGPYGSGLLNMVFSDELTVIELTSLNFASPYQYVVASALGHEYGHLKCDMTDDNAFEVDPELLLELLQKCGTVWSGTPKQASI